MNTNNDTCDDTFKNEQLSTLQNLSLSDGSFMNCSFYVAGKFSCAHMIDVLIKKISLDTGMYCTYNWAHVAHINNKEQKQEPSSRAYLADQAQKEIQGIRDAHFVILYINDPTYAYRGTNTELGMAIALNKPIFIYHDYKKATTEDVLIDPVPMNNWVQECKPIWLNVYYYYKDIQHIYDYSTLVTHFSVYYINHLKTNENEFFKLVD